MVLQALRCSCRVEYQTWGNSSESSANRLLRTSSVIMASAASVAEAVAMLPASGLTLPKERLVMVIRQVNARLHLECDGSGFQNLEKQVGFRQ